MFLFISFLLSSSERLLNHLNKLHNPVREIIVSRVCSSLLLLVQNPEEKVWKSPKKWKDVVKSAIILTFSHSFQLIMCVWSIYLQTSLAVSQPIGKSSCMTHEILFHLLRIAFFMVSSIRWLFPTILSTWT